MQGCRWLQRRRQFEMFDHFLTFESYADRTEFLTKRKCTGTYCWADMWLRFDTPANTILNSQLSVTKSERQPQVECTYAHRRRWVTSRLRWRHKQGCTVRSCRWHPSNRQHRCKYLEPCTCHRSDTASNRQPIRTTTLSSQTDTSRRSATSRFLRCCTQDCRRLQAQRLHGELELESWILRVEQSDPVQPAAHVQLPGPEHVPPFKHD